MNRLDSRLADVLEPIRDMTVGGLLETLARRLETGSDVDNEPMIRDADGRVVRDGTMMLPRRGDLKVKNSSRSIIERIESDERLGFAPVTLIEPDGFVTAIGPFRWDAMEIVAEAAQPRPNWAPVRRWFLEWFQSRYSDVAPDLSGCVHSLTGPEQTETGWRFVADLGSAPIDCISDMIGAFVATGAMRIRIGDV
jgi:hypothetical protein